MNKQKNNTTVILISAILLSFICGTLGAYMVVASTSTEKIVKNVTTSELVETSISSSVDKIYDATVVVVASSGETEVSTGTGFAYKKDGNYTYIMTNNHVVSNDNYKIDKISIILSNGDIVEAELLGGETYADIAVLKVKNNDKLKIAEIGDSTKVKLGDTIFTVGSPMGKTYSGTVTKGILSGKDRLVEVSFSGSSADYYMKVMQIDAAINPGNSGGPLCNVSGEVIGINSLKLVQDEIEGMGFAIPIEDALKYAETIESGKQIVRPYIGVSMLDVSSSYYLWQNGIQIPDGVTKGVVILEVVSSSPAASAGLQKGDIITKINDKEISGVADFRYELYQHEPKEEITITYLRGGKENTTKVKLTENKQY